MKPASARKTATGGRPRLEPDRVRSYQVMVRLTESDAERAREAAERAGVALPELIRQLLLAQRAPAPRPTLSPDVVREIRRQGNNLNQLLRAIHTRSAPLTLLPTVHEILALYRALRALLDGKEPRA